MPPSGVEGKDQNIRLGLARSRMQLQLRSGFRVSAAFMDFYFFFLYIIIMLMLLQGTSVRFVKPLLSLTDQYKNPGADHTLVQKPSNKLLLAQIFG